MRTAWSPVPVPVSRSACQTTRIGHHGTLTEPWPSPWRYTPDCRPAFAIANRCHFERAPHEPNHRRLLGSPSRCWRVAAYSRSSTAARWVASSPSCRGVAGLSYRCAPSDRFRASRSLLVSFMSTMPPSGGKSPRIRNSSLASTT
jgi:hypothetical protein